ncbi:GUN4 domain-containing protein [Tolypothrix sp. VBCCA 56010]|uniref:GUN4 domain-containing protein n=1 Tax=Tolypothrix sp. VBCCA 56010 TaxID=3137731 RepID=UPI003D7DDC05
MNSGTQVNKILILAASPKDMNRVRLEEELRDIEEVLHRARNREQFEVKLKLAVRSRDIRQALLDFEPQIVHFSGHGEGEGGLVFEDVTGKAKLVDAEALAELFDLFTKHVKCVVLNACYSEFQAKAIAQHIDYVIGMSQAIGDRAAIEFAVGFYDGLGAGRSFEDAYKFGKNAIHIASIPEHLTPKLLRKSQLGTEGANTIVSVEPLTLESTSSISNVNELSTTVDYTRLRKTLVEGKWKEADLETKAIILRLSGRESEGWLQAEDCRKLSCEVLREINQLWVELSNHRFGFSVQLGIWQSLGGAKNSGYDTFKCFGDRVGWSQQGNWRTKDSLIFSSDADYGHLPYCREWLYKGYPNTIVSRFTAVMSKLEECEIQPITNFIEVDTTAKSINDNVISEPIDYTCLQDLLVAKKWKEADQETVAVMLKVAGKEKQGWLDTESINNFPRSDLRIIDQLWIKHSDGRFGLSVQQRIWDNVGRDYEKFGDCVGWRKGMLWNKQWLYYGQLTFNQSAPQGHFPAAGVFRDLESGRGFYWIYILSRPDL